MTIQEIKQSYSYRQCHRRIIFVFSVIIPACLAVIFMAAINYDMWPIYLIAFIFFLALLLFTLLPETKQQKHLIRTLSSCKFGSGIITGMSHGPWSGAATLEIVYTDEDGRPAKGTARYRDDRDRYVGFKIAMGKITKIAYIDHSSEIFLIEDVHNK